jgi:acetylornithine deacetylase/succinyl-diaminopimelate desuccinylase-like protein
VSADSGQFSEEQPALLVGLRGMLALQIDVRSAATDVHSGIFGGLLPNAIQALARILDSLRAPDGRVLVDGFYDDVVELDPAERAAMAAIPIDWEAVRRQTGARRLVGEPGYTPTERNWVRPTLDVNGIWGGFQGAGGKTVIPCEAHAKVSCRLVAEQAPARVRALLHEHIRRHAPPEVDVAVTDLPGEGEPYVIPDGHPGLVAAERALREVYGRAPYRVRMGASVPATAILRRHLGVWTVPFGFSVWDDERAHAPDEFVRLASLAKGVVAFRRLMELIADRDA